MQSNLRGFSSDPSTAFMLRDEFEFLDKIQNLKQNLLKNWKEHSFHPVRFILKHFHDIQEKMLSMENKANI